MSRAPNDASLLHYKSQLKRSLSLPDLIAYGLVFIVPIAPVSVFGLVFNTSHGMVPLVYLIGLISMLFTALSYMMMSKAFPFAGSVYTYASRSLGRTVGFLAGWAILLDYLLLPALIYVGGAVAVHSALPKIPHAVSISAQVIVVTAINWLGIETTARASFVLLAFQLLLLLLFAVFGTQALMQHVAGAHWSLEPFYNRSQWTPQIAFAAMSLAVLSFLGFDAISTLSEEAKGGAAAIGRATILSLCLSAVLFVAQTWLASLFVLGRTSFTPGETTNAAFYDIAAQVGGDGFKFLLTLPGVLLAGMAGAVTGQTATARLLFGMARDGELPRALAEVDPRRRVPQRAVLLVAAITLTVALLMSDRLEFLVSLVSFGALLGFFLVHASVIAHFVWRQRSRSWGRHAVVPGVGAIVIGYVLLNASEHAKIAGACWLAVGLLGFIALNVPCRSKKSLVVKEQST